MASDVRRDGRARPGDHAGAAARRARAGRDPADPGGPQELRARCGRPDRGAVAAADEELAPRRCAAHAGADRRGGPRHGLRRRRRRRRLRRPPSPTRPSASPSTSAASPTGTPDGPSRLGERLGPSGVRGPASGRPRGGKGQGPAGKRFPGGPALGGTASDGRRLAPQLSSSSIRKPRIGVGACCIGCGACGRTGAIGCVIAGDICCWPPYVGPGVCPPMLWPP